MVWNNGYNDHGNNNQYMVELDQTGKPVGKAKEIILKSLRRRTEKNWAFFEAENQTWAVYSVTPHTILRVDLDSSATEVLCDIDNVASWKPSYSNVFGSFRGGAQPIRVGENFLNVVHSRFNMPEGVEYVPAVYEFSAKYPFQPVSELPYPLALNFDPHTDHTSRGFSEGEKEDLNSTTSSVIYPTGFAVRGEDFVISGGYNDAHCFIATGPVAYLRTGMKPAKSKAEVTALSVNTVSGEAVSKEYANAIQAELPLFWWSAKGTALNAKISPQQFNYGNFGDDASELLLSRLSDYIPVQAQTAQNKLLAIGSILHRASSGDVVWGSGLKGTDALANHPGGDIYLSAVRGPMTLDVLNKAGWDTSNITELFDPGVLLAHLFKSDLDKYSLEQNSKKGKIRIIPHYRDELVFKRLNPKLQQHFVSADNKPLTVLKQLLGAELVLSSSLHGIIFAESLGIPAIWVDSPGKEAHFKYLDYYESTGRSNIKAASSIQEALKLNAPDLPKFDFEKLLATFPKQQIAELTKRSKPHFQGVFFAAPDFNSAKEKFRVSWSKNVFSLSDATWIKGKSASVTIAPKHLADGYGAINIVIRRCDTRLALQQQEVTITTSAGSQVVVKWAKNDLRSKEVTLPITRESAELGLTIHFKAKVIGPTRSWLKPNPFGSIGIVSLSSD
jgi:pyruvyltransferase